MSLSAIFKIGSSGGMFSLSELMFLGSLKILGLYSNSVGVGNHGPESEVILESFIISGERESNLLLLSSSSVCLSQLVFLSPSLSVLLKHMSASSGLNFEDQLYSINRDITGKEAFCEIKLGVQCSGHVSKIKPYKLLHPV